MDDYSSGAFDELHYYLTDGSCSTPSECCYVGACDLTYQPYLASHYFGNSINTLVVDVYVCNNNLFDDLYVDGSSYFKYLSSPSPSQSKSHSKSASTTSSTSPSFSPTSLPTISSANNENGNGNNGSGNNDSLGKGLKVFIVVTIILVVICIFIALVVSIFCFLTRKKNEEFTPLKEVEAY